MIGWDLLGETVTVETPAGVDRYGDPLPPARRQVCGLVFAPKSSYEGRTATGGAASSPNTVATGMDVFVPVGVRFDPVDVLVRADGSRWHVVGDGEVWRSPFDGVEAGGRLSVERVTG